MTQGATSPPRWNTTDLELLTDSSHRYEIIDGNLFVTSAPHWNHQKTITRTATELWNWSESSVLGEAAISPGIVFTDTDMVIPDIVWISKARLEMALYESGHLTMAPELIVEVLSAGTDNERRNRETKLKLYASRGVQDYWILDWRLQQIEVYRRQPGLLQLVTTLFASDTLTSPLLPGFSCDVGRLFS